jgi:hypothetical protein
MGLSLNDKNRRCDAVAKKTTLKNYLKTNTYEHANCTLTSAIDNIVGTADNDTVLAEGGNVSVADQINGGAGTDTVKIYKAASATATSLPTMSGVESLYIREASATEVLDDTSVSTITGLTAIEQHFGKTAASGISTFTIGADQVLTLKGVVDGDTAGDGTNSGSLSVTTSSTVTSVSLGLSDVGGASAAAHDLDLSIGGAGVKSVTLNSTGASSTSANYISVAVNSTSALETLTITGDKALTVTNAIDFKGTTSGTVNAAGTSGNLTMDLSNGEAITFTGGSGKNDITFGALNDMVTGGAKADTFTTGAGNDNVNGGAGDDTFNFAGNLTKDDVINGGDGFDSVITSETTINSSDKAALAGASNIEAFGSDSTAKVTIDYSSFALYNSIVLTKASNISAAAAKAAGSTAVSVDNSENDDVLVLVGSRTGQAGGATSASAGGGDGGDAIAVGVKVDGGSNAFTLRLIGDVDIKGGDGGASAAPGGSGGDGLEATSNETLNIEVVGTGITGTSAAEVAFAGGAGGSGSGGTGANGDSVKVGSNAKIILSSSLAEGAAVNNNINLGTVKGTNVEIDGTSFAGKITATTADGNAILKGGSKDDTLTGAAGIDQLTGGAGNDTLKGMAGVDTINGNDGNDTIEGGQGADKLTGGAGNDAFVQNAGDGTLSSSSVKLMTKDGSTEITIASGDLTALDGSTTAKTIDLAGTGMAVDVVLDWSAGDSIKFMNDDSTPAAVTSVDTIITDGVAGDKVAFVRGTYSSDNGTFAYAAAGVDILAIYDADATTGANYIYNAVVIVGAATHINTTAVDYAFLYAA